MEKMRGHNKYWGFKLTCISFLSFLIMFWSAVSMAQDIFPSRPITVVIGWAPGGGTDLSIRLLVEEVSKDLGVSLIVVNKPGGGGMVGSELVRQSKPDGYTILASTLGFISIPVLDPKSPYTIDDFDSICLYATKNNVITVKNESHFKTIKEVIDFAKANPGKLTYGTSGIGSTGHFFGELFKQSVGLELTHVPFKGDALIAQAVVGGHVDLGFSTLPGVSSLIKSGLLRGLVLGSKENNPDFPDIPTVTKIGYPNATFEAWDGVVGPKGIPKAVTEKISRSFEKALKNSSVQKGLKEIGQNITYMDPQQYMKFMKQETEKLKIVAKKAAMEVKY